MAENHFPVNHEAMMEQDSVYRGLFATRKDVEAEGDEGTAQAILGAMYTRAGEPFEDEKVSAKDVTDVLLSISESLGSIEARLAALEPAAAPETHEAEVPAAPEKDAPEKDAPEKDAPKESGSKEASSPR